MGLGVAWEFIAIVEEFLIVLRCQEVFSLELCGREILKGFVDCIIYILPC